MAEENGNGKRSNSIGVWLSGGGVIIAIIGAFIWVGGLASQVGQNQTTISALATRLAENDKETHDLEIAMGEACRQLATVEVQMGTVETVINKTQVSNQRDVALLWEKAYGQKYPDVFYPVTIPHEAMPCIR